MLIPTAEKTIRHSQFMTHRWAAMQNCRECIIVPLIGEHGWEDPQTP